MAVAQGESLFAAPAVTEPAPAALRQPKAAEPKPSQEPLQGGTPKKILVVDDDPDMLVFIEKIVAAAGYSVTTVKDGIDAIMRLSAEKFDLVLSDIDMPNLDGLRLLEILNQKNIKVDVVFFTAHDTADSEERGLALGALDYLRKPIKKEILLMRLKNIFAKKCGG